MILRLRFRCGLGVFTLRRGRASSCDERDADSGTTPTKPEYLWLAEAPHCFDLAALRDR